MFAFRARWLVPSAALIFFVSAPAPSSPRLDRAPWLASLGVDRWHAAGFRGQGVKLAIVDSGFRGWRQWLNSALPPSILTRSFRFNRDLEARDSPHGVLCAEVIHAIAPDAELLFANWEPDQPETFVEAFAWARRQGARIVTCSVIMPAWSDGEGGGPVHSRLAAIAGRGDQPGDLVCCACAGNTAQRHWSGDVQVDADGWHQWQSGQHDNPLTPWGNGETVSVEACWSAGPGYRVVVLRTDSGSEIGHSTGGPGAQCAVVRFMPEKSAGYAVRVQPLGPGAGSFHLAALGAWLGVYHESGSIPFPGDGSEFITIGAWDEGGRRAVYSSCGPKSRAKKPDFVALVPLPSIVRPRPFSGTSAAAPQAAGCTALCISRHPEWTAQRIRAALEAAAKDVGEPGFDSETGYGLLRLPEQ